MFGWITFSLLDCVEIMYLLQPFTAKRKLFSHQVASSAIHAMMVSAKSWGAEPPRAALMKWTRLYADRV
jgi:hypothetical protein